MIARFVFAGLLLAFGIAERAVDLAGVVPGENASVRSTPVTRQEVWRAVVAELRARGLAEPQLPQAEDLDMPVAVPALAGRRLRVSSACWDEGSRRAQFRLECGEPGQCLPFLVYLRNYVRDSVAVDVSALSASCRVRLVRPSLVSAAVAAALKPTVRPGDRAMAVLVADRFRMTASVTCLERGREGDVIRVRASDGHIFRARVSGPGRLEALPQ